MTAYWQPFNTKVNHYGSPFTYLSATLKYIEPINYCIMLAIALTMTITIQPFWTLHSFLSLLMPARHYTLDTPPCNDRTGMWRIGKICINWSPDALLFSYVWFVVFLYLDSWLSKSADVSHGSNCWRVFWPMLCAHCINPLGEQIIISWTFAQSDAVAPCDVSLINIVDWRAPVVDNVGQRKNSWHAP